MSQFFIAIGTFGDNLPNEIKIAETLIDIDILNNKALEKYNKQWEELNNYEKRNIYLHIKPIIELRDHRELGVTTPFVGAKLGYIDELTNICIAKIPFTKVIEVMQAMSKLGFSYHDLTLYVGRGY